MKKKVLNLIITLTIFMLNTCIGAVHYIDPVNGSANNDGTYDSPWRTLEEVVDNGLIASYANSPLPYNVATNQLVIKNEGAPISAGDTLFLRDGLHGTLFLQNYNNLNYITILAEEGHHPILKSATLQGASYWRIEGVAISAEPYGEYLSNKLVFLESHSWQGPTTHVEIKKCDIYSTEIPWEVATEWVNKASSGIYIKGDSIAIMDCTIRNIRMGVTAAGDNIEVRNNEVVNFSGDGMRVLGSNILIEGNIIKNCYAVDENHDDGIQSFTTGGLIVDNNIIRGNIIINYEDPNQPLLGDMQGIGCFDGFYNNWVVENNLIYVNHWHGITFLGANNCKIINNTVIDPTPTIAPGGSWIKIDDHKNGTPSTGGIVKNNVANAIHIITTGGVEGDNTLLVDEVAYVNNFVDFGTINFHLLASSILIDNADDIVAPTFDIEGIERPQGVSSDIGCYEYVTPVSNTTVLLKNDEIDVYPNPVFNTFQLKTEKVILNWDIAILDVSGIVIKYVTNIKKSEKIDISILKSGLYFIKITDKNNHKLWIEKIIKK